MKLMRKQELAEAFGQSAHTVGTRISEIEQLKCRYPHAVIRDGNYVACDFYAYYDYLENRRLIRAKELVPPFVAKDIRRALGC